MSAPVNGAPDPLAALRAADHRPRIVVWRERLVRSFNGAADGWSPVGWLRHSAALCLGVLVLVGFGWRLFVASQPPVEESIPFAQPEAMGSGSIAGISVGSPQGEAALSSGSDGSPAASTPPSPDGGELVVHVAGSVRNPGLVTGEVGWRAADVIEAAGGPTPGADLDRLNLAAPLADGQRLFVPRIGEAEPTVVQPTGGVVDSQEVGSGPVDINAVQSAALEELPRVGPVTASAIVSHRETHGPFANVDALVAVRGIGPATLEQLRPHVTVG